MGVARLPELVEGGGASDRQAGWLEASLPLTCHEPRYQEGPIDVFTVPQHQNHLIPPHFPLSKVVSLSGTITRAWSAWPSRKAMNMHTTIQ